MNPSDDIPLLNTITKTGFSGFLQSLSTYYSEFLETDFKATREPKRKYSEKQGQMRVGIQLASYPELQTKLISRLNSVSPSTLVINQGKYSASLSNAVRKGINSAIRSISTNALQNDFEVIHANCIKASTNKNDDFEHVVESIEGEVHRSLKSKVVSDVIDLIKPELERQSGAAAAMDGLESFSDEITTLLLQNDRDALLEAIGAVIFDKEAEPLKIALDEIADENQLRLTLNSYFEDFVAKDAFVEFRELLSTQQITENSQIYLNVGEVITSRSRFPLYYIPADVSLDGDKIKLDLTSAVYANKKAIVFLLRQLDRNHQVVSTNPFSERIFHKSPDGSHFDVIYQTFHKAMAALQVPGDVDLRTSGATKGERYGVTVSNAMTVTLFDKSDESIVNDYEQLVHGLDEDDPLVASFKSMIEGFLTENPVSVEGEVEREWDETDTPGRLVFQSPLPLAEEQRKVLVSLQNPKTKFVIVEGPPGTGKSHTITAIAFELILKDKNVLILSDKKEALDVVEAKLNDVISKVRGADIEYVNPILRLGKSDSNFSNILKRASIDKLKTSVKQFKARESGFKSHYGNLEKRLKGNVTDTISAVESIKFEELEVFHSEEAELFNKYPELDQLHEGSDSQLQLIAEMMDLVRTDRERMSKLSEQKQDGLNFLALNPAIASIPQPICALLKKYPKLDIEKASSLAGLVSSTLSVRNPLWGYLFSGAALQAISVRIEAITGIFNPKPQLEIKTYEKLAAIPEQLRNALKLYGLDSIPLSEFAKVIVLGSVNEEQATLMRAFLNAEFSEDVRNVAPTNIKDLLNVDAHTAQLLSDVRTLNGKRAALKLKFDAIPEFDYYKEKTQFEQMNTLKLVNVIDQRVTDFATEYKADAKTLQQIIRAKSKFPTDKFNVLRQAFPCMIAGLRDFAEFIPFESNLFDLVIIDEASQVSIAQAMPAILRAKQVLVLGDRRQFGNVKTANASKKINEAHFQQVMSTFMDQVSQGDISQETRAKNFNIRHSVMDFFELANNFTIQLKKHFRSYPEMISFSSKYVYPDGLQALKIRGKPIEEVLEFVPVPDFERLETKKNVSEQEADVILERLEKLAEVEDPPSVAIITPFRDQVSYMQSRINDRPDHEGLLKKLKLAVFTFDTCQGEERDVIFYSLVANRQADTLNYIFPRELQVSEDEIDGSLKFQRLNVGFSRGKEKLVFVHSKPVDEFNGSIKRVLQHYQSVLSNTKAMPTRGDVDPMSPMEAEVLDWLKATSFVSENASDLEILPQFALGTYLKQLDSTYSHPAYKVDFLIRLNTDAGIHNVIVEYDGFEFHFDDRSNVDAGNWQSYLTAGDVERECVLESYGYKMLRINRFNVGSDPIETLDIRLRSMFGQLSQGNEDHQVISALKQKTEGVESGELKVCAKCGQAKPLDVFRDLSLKSGFARNCTACKAVTNKPNRPARKQRSSARKRRYRW